MLVSVIIYIKYFSIHNEIKSASANVIEKLTFFQPDDIFKLLTLILCFSSHFQGINIFSSCSVVYQLKDLFPQFAVFVL